MDPSLRVPTPPAWTTAALENFEAFLQDHAACERKASATALRFVVKYPDRTELTDEMISLAREELLHFHQVVRFMQKRGIGLGTDSKDVYINELQHLIRTGTEDRFLDRLMVGAVVEARGCERFGLIAAHAEDPAVREFYTRLARSEAKHANLFLNLATRYFAETTVQTRHSHFLDLEARILTDLPIRPALH